MRVLALGFICALAIASEVEAGPTGKQLYKACQSPGGIYHGGFAGGFCNGYIAGVAGTLVVSGQICLPHRAEYGQVFTVTIKYLQQHPEAQSNFGATAVVAALRAAFPCPGAASPRK